MEIQHRKVVCVTGASGYLGSWLVMRLLQKGYTVHATVRNPDDTAKIEHLTNLAGANDRLQIFRAELTDAKSFDTAFNGCEGVFHVASPVTFVAHDPQVEVIDPAVEGTLNVLRACKRCGSVERVVITSSVAAATAMDEDQVTESCQSDESTWSPIEMFGQIKPVGWMYVVSKVAAEIAAWEFARDNDMDLISILPSVCIGPFLTSAMPGSVAAALALITRDSAFYPVIRRMSYVHVDDVAMAHIFLYETSTAEGRYICSSADLWIQEVADLLGKGHPEFEIRTEWESVEEMVPPRGYSSEKLRNLGFHFRYSVEEMFEDAINCCKEKGLLV